MQALIPQQSYYWPMPGGRPTTKPAPKFGQRMAAFRIARGLSQRELGEKLGMTRDRVVYYEREARNPSLEVVQQIAAFFGVTVGELLNDTTKTKSKPGPPSQFVQLAERLDQLPRAQQKVVARMLEGFLKQAG
jgi:transcriptional regulator with XRE-family HTH domain